MQLYLFGKLKLKLVIYKSLKSRQPLQSIHNNHAAFIIFPQVENREWNENIQRIGESGLQPLTWFDAFIGAIPGSVG